MDVDSFARLVAFLEGVALEHAGDGHLGGEANDIGEAHAFEPLGVSAHFEAGRVGVEDLAGLLDVGLGVGVDLLGGEHGARLALAGRVADAGGVVADDEDRLVAEVLEGAHDAQDDGVAHVDVGAGGVHAQLDTQGLTAIVGPVQLGAQLLNGVHPGRSADETLFLRVRR